MGGATIRHELESIEEFEKCPESCQIFKDASWFGFFQRLEGSDGAIAMEFTKNLKEYQTKVRGL